MVICQRKWRSWRIVLWRNGNSEQWRGSGVAMANHLSKCEKSLYHPLSKLAIQLASSMQ